MVRAVALAPVTARATRGTATSRGSATTVGATATRAATAILTETATTTTTTTTTVTSATSAVPPSITTTETRSRAVIRRPGGNTSRWSTPAVNPPFPPSPSPSSSSRAAAAAALAWMPISFTSTTSTADAGFQGYLDEEPAASDMTVVEADDRIHKPSTGVRKFHDKNSSNGHHSHRHNHHHSNHHPSNGYHASYSDGSNVYNCNGYSHQNDYNGYNGYYRYNNHSNGVSRGSKVTTDTDNSTASLQFSNFLEVALNHDSLQRSHREEVSRTEDEDRQNNYNNSSVGNSVVEIKEEEDIMDIGHYEQDGTTAKEPNTYWRQVGEGTMILETITPLLPLDVITSHVMDGQRVRTRYIANIGTPSTIT
ncbi:hypothetical protein BGZ73_002385 [Actinomortierella ambigua]|nr:hypothetical protein BGZ73_002385 [Actinomortierella ambigua]